jgi:hypothetical protein
MKVSSPNMVESEEEVRMSSALGNLGREDTGTVSVECAAGLLEALGQRELHVQIPIDQYIGYNIHIHKDKSIRFAKHRLARWARNR